MKNIEFWYSDKYYLFRKKGRAHHYRIELKKAQEELTEFCNKRVLLQKDMEQKEFNEFFYELWSDRKSKMEVVIDAEAH